MAEYLYGNIIPPLSPDRAMISLVFLLFSLSMRLAQVCEECFSWKIVHNGVASVLLKNVVLLVLTFLVTPYLICLILTNVRLKS